ncbi:T9SS type A sorting domain-containing protein [Adhaeribacter sp. BT258]|uniref:T9SS type A sorting domain-containing protein n=1 Tax=Adhaeribacter terrigena TaxID=2793070 RepID=A0ABS1C6C6_9BACT|nr:T9SS type A sorting domain-containing protein [Adhaeribacter terrigena]MBK0404924.1 T9SS type A sorting domain-containing protein [Adhaeribacter terrigena]
MKKLYLVIWLMATSILSQAQTTIVVPAGNPTGTTERRPIASFYGYERSHMLYLGSEIGTSGTINAIGFYVQANTLAASATLPVQIYIKQSTATSITASTVAAAETGATLVYNGNLNIGAAAVGTWLTIPLSTPFPYTGGANNLEIVAESNGGGSGLFGSTAITYRTNTTTGTLLQNWNQDSSPPTGTGTTYSNRPNVQLSFIPTAPTEMGISAINLNSGCGLTAQTPVCVTINNFGTAAQSNVPVSYTINGGTPVTAVFPGPLASGASASFCFPTNANLATPGTYVVSATISLPGDVLASNNTATKTITSIPSVSTFPYSENFENGPGGWLASGTSSSWAHGTPAGTVINSAASGTKAWKTSLSGTYNNSEQSRVVGPCFNFSSLTGDPDFEMKIWWNMENNYDKAALQSSIDGGLTWQHVGAFGDPNNWYNNNSSSGPGVGGVYVGWSGRNSSSNGSNGWVKAKHKLTGLAGQSSVLLRVAFSSDGSGQDDGFAFDDIRIGDNSNNLSVNSFVPLTQICGFGASEKVEVMIENLGGVAVSNYTVQYRITNPSGVVGNWVTGPAGPTLQPDTQVPYIFTNQPANLTAAGAYSIEVRITNNQGNDPEPANNNLTYNITNALYSNFPVNLDFETAQTSLASARKITNLNSAITEVAATGFGATASKGLIMDGIDNPKWVVPVGTTNAWDHNPDFFSAVYICLGPTNIGSDSLRLTFDLKQFYKASAYNTNFRVTVNGRQVDVLVDGVKDNTLNPPFAGYDTLDAPWKKVVVDLTPYKNKGGLQIGLESSVKEAYANGNGTANVLDNILVERVTVVNGVKENILQSNVVVFPNPSNGLFNLKVPVTTRNYSVEVMDLTGKLVKQQTVTNNAGTTQLNLNGTAKGIYILKIASEGNVATRKLIVE